MEVEGWVHLLKYDTVYKIIPHALEYETIKKAKEATDQDPLIGYVVINNKKIAILAQRNPEKLPWGKYQVDVVLESTGVFRDEVGANLHIKAGAKKVLISAPSKGGNIQTCVLGVNSVSNGVKIADNASCTTNSIAPIVKIINESLGVHKAALTTIHSYTDDQNLQDGSHSDLRRARSAPNNIVPTSTGAAIATTKTIPELDGKFDGQAIRVPSIVGSLSDLTFIVKKTTTIEEVNQVIVDASNTDHWRGLVGWTTEQLVSSDIIGRSESSIVDLSLTQVIDGDLVKIMTWYDNEWGYCNRLIEQAAALGRS